MELEQLTLPQDITDPEQKQFLGGCIAAMKKHGTRFELRREPGSKKLWSLWRDRKGWNALKSEGGGYKDPSSAK